MQTPSLKKLVGNIDEKTPMHLKTPSLHGLLAEVTEHISPANIKVRNAPL